MASNEDILMRFKAMDDVSKVVKTMESNVLASMKSMRAASSNMDAGLNNLTKTSKNINKSLDNFKIDVDDKEIEKTKEDVDKLDDTKPKIPIKVDGEEELDDVKKKIDDLDDEEIELKLNNMAVMAAVDQIGEGFDRLKQGAGELGEQMGSLLNSAGKQETNKAFLTQAVGDADVAKQKLEQINGVVQDLPGDDSVLQGLLGQAVAKDASLTADELQKMGGAAADYFAAMENFGKNSTEAFQDMNNYLMTGMTAEIERSPILANHIDKLKEATTIQERSKALQEALNEEHWGGISQQDTYNNKLQTFEGMLERGRYNLGGMFQEGAKGGMEFVMQLDDATNGMVGMGIALAGMATPLTDTIMGLGQMATGISAIKDLDIVSYLKDMALAKKAVATADTAESVGDIAQIGNTKKVAQSTTEVVKDASAVGALAPEAAAAEGGIAATGGALTGISTAFTTMIVPLIAIAAVIAVMIPIIAGLVAEALIFIKGIQVLISALGFEDIDLTKATEGIKQVGKALLEIGIAMAEMTFASVVTAATTLINSITGLINPIKTAGEMLVKAANEMKVFETVKVDESVATNLKSISTALRSVSSAMGSLTNVVISMAMGNIATLGGLLGNVNTAISTARQEITHAAEEIAKLKDIPDIDEGVVSKLEKASKAIESISKAMEGLRGIRDGYNWDSFVQGIFGGVNIQTALEKVKQDIIDAGNEIAKLKDLPDIDEGAVSKLEKVSKSIESISKAMEGLRSIRDGYNWDSFVQGIFGGVDIQTALSSVKQDIIDAGNALKDYTGLPEIPEDVGNKMKKIADALKSTSEAMNSLRSIRDTYNWDSFMQGLFGGLDIPGAINAAKGDLISVGNTLASLTGLPAIPDGIYTKVQRIGTSARNVGNVLNGLNNIAFPNIIGMVMIPANIAMSRGVLMNVATQLVTLQSLPAIPDGIYTKVQRIGTSARNVANTLRLMNTTSFPDVVSMALLPVKISAAKLVLENVGRELSNLNTIPPVPEGVGAKVQRIGMGARSVGAAVQGINTIPFVGPDVALRVRSAVSAVKSVANELTGLQGMSVVGNIGQALASIRNAVIQLRGTLNAMRGGFRAAGVGIGSSVKNGIRAGIAGLNGVVASGVNAGMGAGVGPARAGGSRIGNSAKTAFQTSFKISQVASAELQYAIQALQNGSGAFYQTVRDIAAQAVQEAKDAAGQHSPGHIARMWGQEMDYSSMMLRQRGAGVIKSVKDVTSRAVRAFNPNLTSQLDFAGPAFDSSRLDAIRRMNQSSNLGQGQRPVSIHIGEGAIQLDARNLTTTESRQIMINALEGLDDIKGIDI